MSHLFICVTDGLITNAAFAHAWPTRPSTRCRRPRRRLLVKVTAAGTLWVRPEHVGSMATTTTDDILMVYGDGAEGVFETQQLTHGRCRRIQAARGARGTPAEQPCFGGGTSISSVKCMRQLKLAFRWASDTEGGRRSTARGRATGGAARD